MSDGINTRQGAQLLVESNVWVNSKKPLYSTEGGFAVERGNVVGGQSNAAPEGSLTSVPYGYDLLGGVNVVASVTASAGQTLSY